MQAHGNDDGIENISETLTSGQEGEGQLAPVHQALLQLRWWSQPLSPPGPVIKLSNGELGDYYGVTVIVITLS